MMMNSADFVKLIRDVVREELGSRERFRIGTIATAGSKPTIRFAGETQPSTKGYSYLKSYTPKTGDKVLLARVKNTYVILGKLEG